MELIYSKEQLIRFLHKLDARLDKKANLHIIGGTATAIAYFSKSFTRDIDTWKLEKAVERAYEELLQIDPKLVIPISEVKVKINSPEMFNRFKLYKELEFKNLQLFFPEAEDLFLLKAQRASEKDIDDLIELHKNVQLDFNIILDRFESEILPLNPGDDYSLKENFYLCIDEVFGDKCFKEAKKILN